MLHLPLCPAIFPTISLPSATLRTVILNATIKQNHKFFLFFFTFPYTLLLILPASAQQEFFCFNVKVWDIRHKQTIYKLIYTKAFHSISAPPCKTTEVFILWPYTLHYFPSKFMVPWTLFLCIQLIVCPNIKQGYCGCIPSFSYFFFVASNRITTYHGP